MLHIFFVTLPWLVWLKYVRGKTGSKGRANDSHPWRWGEKLCEKGRKLHQQHCWACEEEWTQQKLETVYLKTHTYIAHQKIINDHEKFRPQVIKWLHILHFNFCVTFSVRKMSKMTEKLSKTMLDGVGIATGAVMAPMMKSEAGKKFLNMVPGEVLLASLDAVSKCITTIIFMFLFDQS